MGTLVKIILGGLALFMVLGGPRLLKQENPPTITQPVQPAASEPKTSRPQIQPLSIPVDLPSRFNGQPDNLITSLDWLEANGRPVREMQTARLTYYLLARSDRCHVDSVAACLREKILAAGIDPIQFQYTFFLDRVMLAGSGHLFWGDKAYFVNYAGLRRAGWNKGERNFKNQYYCSNFSFRSKKPIEFIEQHLSDKTVFVPLNEARYPNGATASGQEAVNWHTVSVNPYDFPLSVPDTRRRERLTQKYALEGKLVPQARSFIVLIAKDGRMFLTEAMDTGSGVKRGWIDWRIGNTSTEISYFHGIGPVVKAICYVFRDPNIRFEQVLAASKPVVKK